MTIRSNIYLVVLEIMNSFHLIKIKKLLFTVKL